MLQYLVAVDSRQILPWDSFEGVQAKILKNKLLHGGPSDIKLMDMASDCHLPSLALCRLLNQVDEALWPCRVPQDPWEGLCSATVDDPVHNSGGEQLKSQEISVGVCCVQTELE